MLKRDSDIQLQQMRGNLVPDGPAPTGYRLTVVSQSPFAYDWRQAKDDEILRGRGDPNVEVVAPKGSLYVDVDAPALWQNTDGLDTWVLVGSAAITDPSTLDFLKAFDDGSGTGLTNDTFHTLVFDVNAPFTSGTDISIDSGVPTINADGVYAVTLWFGALSDAAGDTFDYVQLSFHVDRAGAGPRYGPTILDTHAPVVTAAGKHFAEAAFTWTGFCPATTSFEAQAKMAGDVGNTWSIYSGVLHIDRIV